MNETIDRLRKICAHPFVFDFSGDEPEFVSELVQLLNVMLAQQGSAYRFKSNHPTRPKGR
jgi:hypothetical protein